MTIEQKVVEKLQQVTTKYPTSTVYIMVVVTLILLLQVVTLAKGGM